MRQKQMIALAEQAEAYLKYEAREGATSGSQHNNKAKMRNTSGAREFRKKAKAGAL